MQGSIVCVCVCVCVCGGGGGAGRWGKRDDLLKMLVDIVVHNLEFVFSLPLSLIHY